MKEYAILFRFTPGLEPADDVLEIIDAPDEVWITDELFSAPPRPDLVGIGDGIITFAPRDVSRVSYREVRFDAETNMHILERIS